MRVIYLYDGLHDEGVQIAKWSSLCHCAVCIEFHKKQSAASVIIIIIIIIISCYPLWASTKRRHLVLSLAILFNSLQLFPFSNASLWTDLRHVCLGLPLLLFPCVFQSKASLSIASFPFLRNNSPSSTVKLSSPC
jgi:hypothetical protein